MKIPFLISQRNRKNGNQKNFTNSQSLQAKTEITHGWQEIGKTIEALTISGICTG